MSIQTVGIIGAGTMGNGIAQACAVSGVNVVMVDISQAAVDKGIATVASSLDRLIKKEKCTEADKAAALSRIKGSTNYDDLKAAQLVIEAATENFDLKVKILKQVDAALGAKLEWMELPDGYACRILQVRPDSPLESEDQWPAYYTWLEQAALRMSDVFRPLVKELT